MTIVGLVLVLVIGLVWAFRYANKPAENSPVSLALMFACVDGIFAVACYYGYETGYASVVVILASLALWSVGGFVLSFVGKGFNEGPVIGSAMVEFGLLLVHTTDWQFVLEVTAGSLVAFAALALVWRIARPTAPATRS